MLGNRSIEEVLSLLDLVGKSGFSRIIFFFFLQHLRRVTAVVVALTSSRFTAAPLEQLRFRPITFSNLHFVPYLRRYRTPLQTPH